MRSFPAFLLVFVFGIQAARAEVALPAIFTDHMVLQMATEVPVWGTAEAGEKVTVEFGGKSASVATGADGKWMVRLEALVPSTEGRPMKVKGAENEVVIQDVLVGDVWLCSGQSNMEWQLGSCNAPEDITSADFPAIRRIKMAHVSLGRPTDVVPGKWEVCSPATARGFTAVGFYFARRIHRDVGVPIGIIDDNWGGTRIEPWTPPVGFAGVESLKGIVEDMEKREVAFRADFGKKLDEVEAWIGNAREALKTEGDLPPLPQIPGNPAAGSSSPMALYNGMIHPIVPFGIKGALWYQGESNGNEGNEYFEKMRALVGGWRQVWEQTALPFYFVQLADFKQPNPDPAGGDGWARLRMAQLKAVQEIPHTGMAVAIDVGNATDIHPKNKFDVGERLALWALHNDYGSKDVPSGPLFKSAEVESGKIRVKFDWAETGLIVGKKEGREPTAEVPDGKLERFAIAGEDKKWVWADAVIDGGSVVVSSKDVPAPVAVRYAYSTNPEGANLYNKAGLPASPFRSDDW